MGEEAACLLCDGDRAAEELNRVVVWEDELWRLSMSRRGYTTARSPRGLFSAASAPPTSRER
jgi:hypothetical protein